MAASFLLNWSVPAIQAFLRHSLHLQPSINVPQMKAAAGLYISWVVMADGKEQKATQFELLARLSEPKLGFQYVRQSSRKRGGLALLFCCSTKGPSLQPAPRGLPALVVAGYPQLYTQN